MGARVQAGVGDHLIDALEPGHVAQLGPDGRGNDGTDARQRLQALAVVGSYGLASPRTLTCRWIGRCRAEYSQTG